jgi:hypothetical protein
MHLTLSSLVFKYFLTHELQHHPATIQHPQGPDISNVGGQDIRSVDPGVKQLGIQDLLEAGGEVGAEVSPSDPPVLAGSLRIQ